MFAKLGNFNLTLEILEGCGFNCNNCAVDKSFVPTQMFEKDESDLLHLVDDLVDFGLTPFEYTIGPTDITTAANRDKVLSSSLATNLSKRFNSTVVSLAMLSEDGLPELAREIDKLCLDKKLRVIIPATIGNLRKEKYVSLLKQRVEKLKSLLSEASFYRIYLTINAMEEDIRQFTPELDAHITEMDLGVHMVVDYSFAHSRKGLNNLLTVEKLKYDVALYIDVVQQQVGTSHKRYLVPDVEDGIELLYRDGDLYYVPILLEKFPIFEETFKIPKPWNAEAVLDFKQNLYSRSMEIGVSNGICGDCLYIDNCSRGDVITVMDYINLDKCIINMKGRWDLGSKLINGKPPCSNLHPEVKTKIGL